MSSVVKDWPTRVAVLRGLSRAADGSMLAALWSEKLPLSLLNAKSSRLALKLLRSWACLSRLAKLACQDGYSNMAGRQPSMQKAAHA